MIIFDLDGTLADCEHRRHFVDSRHPKNIEITDGCTIIFDSKGYGESNHQINKFQPDWKSFYEACDKDKPIHEVKETFISLLHEPYNREVYIWSGRCESVRDKTIKWVDDEIFHNSESIEYINRILKMRPIGDNTPDDQLKEMWLLDEMILNGKTIDFVFDSHPESIKMWRRRGIFVFDCNQSGSEF